MIELSPILSIASVVGLGVAAQWLAWRVSLPAILPLLIIGFLVGPVFGLIRPTEFLSPELLFPTVSLAVGLILFEGGLTLKFPEVKETRQVVTNLVTIGAAVTWLGSVAAGYFIAGLSLSFALLFGALIIVTGPTVIGPLLRNVRPTARVANVLKWEGILIDPVGAIVAVLVFEYLVIENRSEALGQTLLLFLSVVGVGTVVGVVGGLLLALVLRRRLIPDYLINVVVLAFVFTFFAVSNTLADESGLLATTLMGLILANLRIPNIENILSFKEELTILFISVLFIVLAANVELAALLNVLTLRSLALLAFIMLVVRPLNIFVSTMRSSLTLREKLFLSWIAPRGIVAAAVTSLFAAELGHGGFEDAGVLVPLVFLVIVGTVALNSLTATPVARLLGVAEPDPQGFLILGAHSFARRIAAFLQDEGITVTLGDTNWSNVAAARVEGLNAYYGSLLSEQSNDEVRLSGIGKLLALTSNDEANALTALKYAREFDSKNVYQLAPNRSSSERGQVGDEQRGRIVFHKGINYAQLSNLFNRGAELKKTPITEEFGVEDFEEVYGKNYVPMFVISGDKGDKQRKVRVITEESPPPESGSTLVSLVLEPEPSNTQSAAATA